MQRRCIVCNKPLIYNRTNECSYCSGRRKRDGFEHRRIRFGLVGSETINYQQHLHRKFFNCNAPIEYRGIKENRVYNSLEPSVLASNSLLYSQTFHVHLPRNILWLYNKIKHLKNYDLRTIYNISLYHIHYYIVNPQAYNSHEQFLASMVQTVFSNIIKTYIRTNRSWKQCEVSRYKIDKARAERVNINNKDFNALCTLFCEIGSSIVSSAYKDAYIRV